MICNRVEKQRKLQLVSDGAAWRRCERRRSDGAGADNIGVQAAEAMVDAHHRYAMGAGQCSSLLAQCIRALSGAV
jgi:hypothetical protein